MNHTKNPKQAWVTLIIIGLTYVKQEEALFPTLVECISALRKSVHLLRKVCNPAALQLENIESLTEDEVNGLQRNISFTSTGASVSPLSTEERVRFIFSLNIFITTETDDAFKAFSRLFQSHLTAPPES